MYFEKPPLIELIAELRWLPGDLAGDGENPSTPHVRLLTAFGRTSDQLFMRFAGLIGAKGFLHSERLLPQGFPGIPFQPVYRYSRGGAQPGQPIFQLGLGVFSVHITPPYKTWNDFRPFIEIGVSALLEARQDADRAQPFNTATVRYLDCFSDQFLRGMSSGAFMHQVLGIGIGLPIAITSCLDPGKEITPAFQLLVPLTDGRQMEISLANGNTPAGTGLIMNSSVSSSVMVPPEQSEVMQFLDGAHQVISDMFVSLTKEMHSIMEPRE